MFERQVSHRETLLGTTPEIELVNVQYSVPETIIHLFGMEAVKQYYLEAGKKVFDELGPETLRRRGVTERVLYGDIGKTLAEEAEVFKADLIVMGTRGLNPVKGLLLGSVSNDLLARTKVPMLLLRDKTPPLQNRNLPWCMPPRRFQTPSRLIRFRRICLRSRDKNVKRSSAVSLLTP